jgi:hypothetical protein
MARYSGILLATSSILMVVLVIVMIATHQGNKGFGVLQLAIAACAVIAVVSSIFYGLKRDERDRKPHRSTRTGV